MSYIPDRHDKSRGYHKEQLQGWSRGYVDALDDLLEHELDNIASMVLENEFGLGVDDMGILEKLQKEIAERFADGVKMYLDMYANEVNTAFVESQEAEKEAKENAGST